MQFSTCDKTVTLDTVKGLELSLETCKVPIFYVRSFVASCDLRILARSDGQDKLLIPVDKTFICDNLEYFKNMLNEDSTWIESKNVPTITMDVDYPEILGEFIKALYDQKLNLTSENFHKFYQIADYLQDEKHIKIIRNYIKKETTINDKNCIELMKYKICEAAEYVKEFRLETEESFENILEQLVKLSNKEFINIMNMLSATNTKNPLCSYKFNLLQTAWFQKHRDQFIHVMFQLNYHLLDQRDGLEFLNTFRSELNQIEEVSKKYEIINYILRLEDIDTIDTMEYGVNFKKSSTAYARCEYSIFSSDMVLFSSKAHISKYTKSNGLDGIDWHATGGNLPPEMKKNNQDLCNVKIVEYPVRSCCNSTEQKYKRQIVITKDRTPNIPIVYNFTKTALGIFDANTWYGKNTFENNWEIFLIVFDECDLDESDINPNTEKFRALLDTVDKFTDMVVE